MFRANPNFPREVARSTEMRRFLTDVTNDAARAVDADLPSALRTRGAEVRGDVVSGVDGLHGEVQVHSSFWHLPEFGGGNWPARPYFRSGVIKVLASRGGRLTER